MDNIAITYPEQLGIETAETTHRTPLGYAPYGLSGIITSTDSISCAFDLTNEVLCAGCATDEQLGDPRNSAIFGDAETDYPGMVCEECQNILDTNLLVYKSQDPELFWRLEQSEAFGFYNDIPDVETLCEEAKVRAYELGWDEGSTFEGEYSDVEPEEVPEYPTDSAHYANVILPKLRGIAGYADSGHGTFTDAYYETSEYLFDEDVSPAFFAGYYDALTGSEYNPSDY